MGMYLMSTLQSGYHHACYITTTPTNRLIDAVSQCLSTHFTFVLCRMRPASPSDAIMLSAGLNAAGHSDTCAKHPTPAMQAKS